MNRIFTVLGIFLLFSFHLAAQTITGVSIPAGNYKINDAITINFASANTAGTALVAGSTVNGVALTGFTNLTGGNYSAIYTVAATNTDRASVGVIPINIGLTSGTDGPFFTAAATSGGTVTIDANSPTVSSIVKASTDPSNATNVNFTVTFNELVDATTLTTADFDLTLTGGVTATVNSVTPTTGTSTTFTVNVNAISTNEGTLRLNKTNNAYSDAIGNSNTATFSAGEVYTIDRLAPSVSSIIKASTDPSNATNVNFTVTFSELVDATTLTTADFDLTLTGGVTATVNSVTPTTGTSTTFTVNVNTISTNDGTLRLNKTNNAYSDAIGNSSTTTFSPGAGGTYSIDRLAQSVSSIVKASTNPSNATNVNFTVTFGELIDATTLTTADFDLTLTGGVTATVNSVSPTTGTSTTFTVNVNSISTNEGTLRLNKTNDAYSDAIGNSSTATFSAGEVYTIDRLAPTVSGIVRASADPTGASNVDFTVTFSELVDATTLANADFDLTLTGGVTATVNSVTPATGTSATFTVNVNAISNNQGTLQLNKTNNAYSDAIGNSSTATFSAGEVYTIDRLAPTADAPDAFQTVQSLKSGATSASQVRSTKNGAIYLVKNGTAVTSQAQINAAVTAKNAFLGRAAAVANTGYTITIPIASLINDGNYNIVAVDGSGNVSNPSSGADSWLTVDNTAPTVAITLVSASPTTASAGFLDFTVTFSESVTGVDITDFVLASATVNDAVGTISNLSGSGSSYTVTVNTLAGNYANGTQAILNLDIIGSPGIADLATNSFGGSVTTDAQYLVDNTKPTVVQNDFTFNANGAAAETVVFTVSEPLNGSLTNNIAGFIIGGGSGTTNPIGVYNAGNGTVTLTNGGANATWGPGITVSYTPGNMSDLLANTMLAIGATPVSVPNVSLQAGDIAFTNINTRTGSGTGTGSGNGFSFVLLKNLPANTKIFFTNRGWDGTQLQAAGIDMTWTSPGSVTNAGTEVYFNGSNFVSGSNAVFGTAPPVSSVDLPDNGDQILAYQGSLNSPLLFIAAININSDGTLGADNWNTAASVGTDVNRSALPPGLTEGTNAISLALLNSTNVLDNGQYKLSGVAQEGSAQQLRSAMCTAANWNNRDANAYSASGVTYRIRPVITAVTIPNGTNYIISGTPYTATITVHDDRGSAHTLLASNIDGFSLSNLIRTNSTTYTADFTVTEGGNDVLAANNIPISVNLQSAQGNATAAVTPINTVALFTTAIAQANDPIDANSPHVVSINRQSSTNAWSTSGGTSAATVVFRVTFSDDMASLTTLAANDFAVIAASGLAGAPSINNIAAVTGTKVFDISVTGYTGTGTIGLNYVDSEAGPGGSVTDLIGNPTKSAALAADGSFTGQTFSIVLPEPDATAFAVTAPNVTQNSITLQWNSPNSPTPLPTHFLVLAAPTLSGSFPDLEDLIVAPGSHHVITPGALAQIIPRVSGTNTALFTGLQSGTSYDFKVYKYSLSANNSNDNIDYEMTNPGTITRVTNTASTSWLTLSSGAIPIGSTKDNSGASVPVISFKIYDDGLDPIVPNVMNFNDNGLGNETITFSLREELATSLPSGSVLTGFTASSTGATPINAVYYTSGPTVNIVTLTSPSDGDWNAATTINYNAIGNVLFKTLGKMQSIANHAVSAGVANSVFYNNPVGTASFAVPAGVTSVVVETWGAGGSAGGWDNVYGGGSQGGGGGAYSRSVVPVTPGGSYDVTVGKGGVPVNPNFSICCNAGQKGGSSIFSIPSGSSLVVAEGGDGGESGTYFAYYGTSYNGAIRPTTFGFGGKTSGGIGDIKHPGGNGGNGGGMLVTNSGTGPFPMGPNDAGGGGSSAGNSADGVSGAFASTGICTTCSSAGGNAPLFGGDGGSGFQNSTGANGVIPGGGGGGTGGAFASGAGADGQVKVTYYLPASTGTSDWAGDDSPFKFSQIVITKGPGNNNVYLGDWRDIIAGAELRDSDNNFYNSSLPPGNIPGNITINPTNITFSNIPAALGTVPDAPNTTPSSKTYTVKIWLRNDLSPALASIVDGLNLEFSLDVSTAANLTYDDLSNSGQKSSRLASPAVPFNSGTAQIQVDATQLDFSTNPNPSAFVLANVTAASTLPDLLTRPVVRARDVHGNTDKDYSATSLAITTTGGMSTIPNTLSMAAGVAAFPPTFQYQDDGDGTLTVSGGGLTSAISSPVVVNYSNTTAITTGTVAPLISSLKTSNPYLRVFDFNITDDNGSGGDGAPTRFNELILNEGPGDDFSDWSEALAALPTAGILLYDGTTSVFGAIGANTITFSGINPNTLGYVTDNTTKTYQVWILLKSAMGGTLPDDVDNKNFVFRVQDTFITTAGSSSAFTGTNDINSGSANIKVDVIASKLKFSADPAASLLVGKDISSQLPVPVVEALDANNNRDLNYNSTTVNVTNSGSLTMSNMPGNGSFINGLLTFPNTFQFNTTGTGVTLNVSSTAPAPALPGVLSTSSTSFDVRGGDAGTITASSALTEPPTISSLVDLTHTPAGLPVFDFTINDDPAGTPAGEDDGNPTQLTGLYIRAGSGNTVLGWDDVFATATLSDGTNTVTVTTIHSSNYFYFDLSSVAGQALGLIADNGSKTYTLKVWLKTALGGTLPTTIDGKFFVFDVKKTAIDITTGVNSTNIIDGQTQNSGIAKNQVDVHATQIDFTMPSSNTSASLNSNLAVVVKARDANTNLDLDFNGTITSVTNANIPPSSMQADPDGDGIFTNIGAFGSGIQFGTTQFSSGSFSFPTSFQFTSGNNNDDVTLSITAGGISSVPVSPGPAPYTPIITLTSSFESLLRVDPAFVPATDMNYELYQDINSSSTSIALAQFKLSDGDGSTPDLDGAGTNIDNIQFSITNPSNIRSLGIYVGSTLIQAKNNIDFVAGSPTTVTFTGLSGGIAAPDNGSLVFTVRASFFNTSTAIHDNDAITLRTINVTQNGGSKFNQVGLPPIIGGVGLGGSKPISRNIEVTATRLDFVASPAAYEGIQQALAIIPVVQARDVNQIIDVDHNFTGLLSAVSAGLSTTSFPFSNGIATLTGLQYSSAGNGKLTMTSNGLSSNSGGSIACTNVEVINVYTTLATSGVISSPNLPGGAVNRVIFGVTFNRPYVVTGEPKLNRFIINFSNPITNIFTNVRVFESTNVSYDGTDVNVVTTPSIGATVSPGATSLTIDFTSGTPRDLSLPGNSQLTYFLMVDVSPTASGSTPTIQPSVLNNSTGVTITKGSVYSSALTTNGQTYSFASIFPPTLVSSNPTNGQLNVDKNKSTIDLVFSVPVWTMDSKISLYNKTDNVFVGDLTAINGQFSGGTPTLAGTSLNPLKFALPTPLLDDHVYYVTIQQGDYDNSIGIVDESFNEFPGFTYSGTLYFKTSNPNPPKLLNNNSLPVANNPTITNITATGATINATFDQQGTAYFMVVNQGDPIPTNAQISDVLAPYAGTVIDRGNFAINQVNPISQFGQISATLSTSTPYDVWIYAENNAMPTVVPTLAPYGSSANNFIAGAPGPTLTFTGPSSIQASGPVLPIPAISVCRNSYQTLNQPIQIVEGVMSNFAGIGTQVFNLLLPSGFQFDISTVDGTPTGAPLHGTLTLTGADFSGTPSLQFINSTTLRVSFQNTGSSSRDNITISGLRVIAVNVTSGYIVRLGGNALLTALPDLTQVASLSSFTAPTIEFTNEYSQTAFPLSPTPITIIPDDQGQVELVPLPNSGDYGPSAFSGSGVNINQLNVTAVTKDSPFNITLTHTDNNGCSSDNPIQYSIYDHNAAIKGLSSTFCLDFMNLTGNAPVNTPSLLQSVVFTNLGAHFMASLTATIPANASPTQKMIGSDWTALINTLPMVTATIPDATVTGRDYHNYKIDGATILNANTFNPNLPNPYSYFKQTTPQSQTYYDGGSLGVVEFTGGYWNQANQSVYVPLKQNVEFFLPAVPVVEVGKSNLSPVTGPVPIFCEQGGDVTINGYPAASVGSSVGSFSLESNGTIIHARDLTVAIINQINIAGKVRITLSKPVNLSSTSSISIYGVSGTLTFNSVEPILVKIDNSTYDIDRPYSSAETLNAAKVTLSQVGFTDNSNGTASLNPLLFNNSYNDIKVGYTYKSNDSPCESSGSLTFRIAPNPVAKFTFASDLTASILDSQGLPGGLPLGKASVAKAYCAGIPIIFNPANSTIAADNIASYNWNFGDINSATNQGVSTVNNPIINNYYPTIGTYHAALTVVSDKGCASINADNAYDITVGAIPSVYFDMTGVSTTDQIVFTDKSTVSSNGSNSFSQIANITWDYGDGISNTTSAHQYTATGHFNVTSTVTTRIGANSGNVTELGCSRSFERHIVILDKKTGFYEDDFESVTSKWQTIKDSLTTNASLAVVQSSWKRGTPGSSRAYIKSTPVTGATNNNVWATGLTGTYLKNERSFLYSPSIDMTGFLRPMISFDANKALGKDGVVLEYSTDNLNVADPNKVWTTVGNNTTGVNWFNDQIIGSKPGKQSFGDFGWSGSSTNADTPSGWMESKHELLNAISTPTNQRTNVVFRFSFATINDGSSNEAGTGSDGFAMDNFRIGERTRTILLENFTTTNAKDATQISLVKSENSFISTFIAGGLGTTVVKLNYHIGFTGNDPFNLDNPADPSARALYYNVKNVPWAFLDGNRPAIASTDSRIESWAQKAYDSQTLQLGQAEINVPPFITNPDGSIKFSVEVKALYDLPANTVVHVAVIEQSILKTGLSSEQQAPSLINTGENNFDYVLKKMLPNALGTKLGALAKGMPTTPLKFEYYPDPTKLYKDDNDLAIIVFLQNEDTKTIYQTEYVTGIADPSSTITGVETPLVSLEDVSLYPNPADHELTILLPRKAISDVTIQLFDQVGKSVLNSTIKNGEQKGTLNVQGLAESMYLMRLVENGEITMKKVMVVHQN